MTRARRLLADDHAAVIVDRVSFCIRAAISPLAFQDRSERPDLAGCRSARVPSPPARYAILGFAYETIPGKSTYMPVKRKSFD